MPHPDDLLTRLLAELADLAPDDQENLGELGERLAEQRLRVAIVGEAKRGKSTVANALLDRNVLPVGVAPLTAIATRLVHGEEEHVEVAFIGGRREHRPLSDLAGLVTEQANPGNRLGVTDIVVHLDAPILARGLEIVDTPGTGSVHEHNASEADRAIAAMDAAIVVLTADPPISAAERDLLTRITNTSVATFVLLNKIDYLDGTARAEAEAFTADVVQAAAGTRQRIYPVSARRALAGVDGGFAAFLTAFDRYLDTARAGDVRRSVAGHAARLTRRLLDETRLTLWAAQLRDAAAADRVAAFRTVLADVAHARQDADDLVHGETGRLLAQLNQAAHQAGRDLTRRISRQLDAELAGPLADASPADIQRRGRQRLVELTAPAVAQWRAQQNRRLEEGLTHLDARLVADLDHELDRVRDQAADLLGLDLAVPASPERLLPDREYVTSYAEDVGQTELLAGAIRRRLPGELGRRRAVSFVRRQAAHLVPQQIGRSRGDLQYRLTESRHRLLTAVERRYRDATERLAAALDAADRLAADTPAARRHRDQLQQREATLRDLLDRIENAAATTADPARTYGSAPAPAAAPDARVGVPTR